MNKLNLLENKTVLVTGGTSGIGLATSIQAKEAGANVIILGSDKQRTKSIADKYGFYQWIAADISNPDAIAQAFTDVSEIHHLVLLAGSFIGGGILDAPINDLRKIFEERLWGSINILRAVAPKLDTDASITFVSGELASRPNGQGTSVLCAAVNAVEGLAKSLAIELAPRRINTVSPGPIDTPLFGKVLGDGRNAYIESRSQTLPLKRFGTPEEAASAINFLMTNTYMNGETLHIDGGSRLV